MKPWVFEFETKKKSLLDLLKYIDENNFWNLAKYLINYIEKSNNVDTAFLDFVSDTITDAISTAEDNISKKELEKASKAIDQLKNEENASNINDESETDLLINKINNIW